MNSDFSLQSEPLVITIPPQLTYPQSSQFATLIQEKIQTQKVTQLTLDFAKLVSLDSSGMGVLAQLSHPIHNLRISCLHVQPALQAELLDRIPTLDFPICESSCGASSSGRLTSKFEAPVGFSPSKSQQFLPHPSVHSPWKRIIDILGALVGLGITAVLLLPITIAIKLDSPGPVFFKQVRIGCGGRRFWMYKFRSMVKNAELLKNTVKNQIEGDGKFFKNDADPRITRVGRLLRKTSLDEFPQFWHVLRGEMSLVGTRPPTPDEVERYAPEEWQRLQVKPGITGEWQVRGRSSIRSFADVVKLDLDYQQHWSVFHDLKLIVQTVLVLFNKNNHAC